MPHYSANDICRKRDYEKKNKTTKLAKKKNFTAKTENQNLKAPSNNVEMPSDKTLITQIFPNETR